MRESPSSHSPSESSPFARCRRAGKSWLRRGREASERLLLRCGRGLGAGRRRPRIAAAVSGRFPLYFHTFAYQELLGLHRGLGADVKVFHLLGGDRSAVQGAFGYLLRRSSWLPNAREISRRDLQHYRRVAGDRVRTLHPIPPPTDADVAKLAGNLRNRIVGLLLRRGYLTEDGHVEHELEEHTDPLATYYAAGVQGRNAEGPNAGAYARRLRVDAPDSRPRHKPLCASFDGFSLHANITVEGNEATERLCRYVARPPIVMERLSITPTGRVRYRFRRPWRDGTVAIELEPLAFIARLAALVPRPRKHLVTYHGILAPAAPDRAQVVPRPIEEADPQPQGTAPPTHRRLRPERFSWPQLLQRVFRVDVLLCPCGGRRRVLDFILDPTVIRRILTHLGLPAEPRRHAPARSLPQKTFAFT